MSKEARNRKLSVAIVSRDDETLVQETLDNICDLADEILLLAAGDTDSDIATALQRDYESTVIPYNWNDSYGEARNELLSHVTGEWVLWLEPGETITPQNRDSIRIFVNSQVDIMTAYVMLVRAPQVPGTIGSEQLGEVRLLPHHPSIRFDGRIRETVFQSLAECGMSIEAIPYIIQRNPVEIQPGRKTARVRRDVQLVELEIKNQGPSPRLMICMAEAVQTLGDHKNALMFFEQACRLADQGSSEMLEAFYGILTSLDSVPDGLDTQIQTCLTALEVFPLDAQLLCAIGGYLQTKGHLELARRSFETAYKHGQINLETWHIDDIDEIAASCFAITTHQTGNVEEAESILVAALQECPHSIRLRRQMIDLATRQGNLDKALAHVGQLPEDFPNVEQLRIATRGACLATESKWEDAVSLLTDAYNQGCREAVCLRWMATSHAALGNTELAREILAGWQRIEPQNDEARLLISKLVPSQGSESPKGPHLRRFADEQLAKNQKAD